MSRAFHAGPDERPEVLALFAKIRENLEELRALLALCDDHWGGEDAVYRIVEALRALAPDRELNPWFLQIVNDGTGKTFDYAHNARWLEVTRPMLEAFFHARYFLEMVCRYGTELDAPPTRLPSGWASVLNLYDLR